jgi:signal peptidase I
MEATSPLKSPPGAGRPESAREAHEAAGARLSAIVTPAAKLVLAALVLALLVRTLVVEPFAIPSGSMSPGLEAGDFIFVDKMAYGWSRSSLPLRDPEASGEAFVRVNPRPVLRGDVIVFAGPGGQDYVKRVIGVAGDRVELARGRLLVNGTTVPCRAIGNGLCREVLPGGASHAIRDNGRSSLATFPEIGVPAGHYFVLGDNRGASADSRVPRAAGGVGLVASHEVLGRAQRIFFSARDGVHWDRIGQRID